MKSTLLVLAMSTAALTPTVSNFAFASPDSASSTKTDAPRTNRRAHRQMRKNLAKQICTEVSCTDEQRTQVKAVFAEQQPPKRPDRSNANKTLADAFRSTSFSQADIKAHHTAMMDNDSRLERRVETMSELHTIFNASQREALANAVEQGKLFERKHEGRQRPQPSAEQIEQYKQRRLSSLCEPIQCTDAQKQALGAALTDVRDMPRPVDNTRGATARQAIADAFRADPFDEEGLTKTIRAQRELQADQIKPRQELMVKVHNILEPDQRETIADQIEKSGPRAILGGKHHQPRHRKNRPSDQSR